MTDSPDEYGELLRRALSAEANSVVPSPDGLEIIRARVERRGLRGLMWWRAGASVAGVVLVAATVVMVVPQFREQVIPQFRTGEVNYTETTPPADGSATSRPPSDQGVQPPPPITKSTAPAPLPTQSRSFAPSVKPTPRPTVKATPSPTCPTSTSKPVPPEGTPEKCEETETPTPTPTPTPTLLEPPVSPVNPCPIAECPPPDDTPPPLPTESSTPVPTPAGN
jgi:hypothetical protein